MTPTTSLRPSAARPLPRALAAAFLGLATLAAGCEPTYRMQPRAIPRDARGHFREAFDVTTFQRGNIHTHSRRSDGDHPPEAVYAWYRDHGYNFLALTDHNKLTDPRPFRGVETPNFTIITGEEVSLRGAGKQVHVNALCHRHRIGGKRFRTVEEALQWGVARTNEQGGAALINHPNFYWAFGADEMAAAGSARMIEVWSGHPKVYPEGNWNHPSVESMWDDLLTQGFDFAAAAVDDMHNLNAGADLRRPGPGRGWIDVFAQRADEREICDSMRRGGFIASNGVRLSRITVRGDTFSLVAAAPGGTVEWIGREGRVLSRQQVDPSGRRPNVYRLRGGEDYVRARITAPGGARAWTQAYRVMY